MYDDNVGIIFLNLELKKRGAELEIVYDDKVGINDDKVGIIFHNQS